MRNIVALCILYFVKSMLWFRYRVTVKGLEHLNPETLNKKGGVLFLPNHPTMFVDPTLVSLTIWKKYPIRPMIVEYMYYAPIVHSLMKFMNGLPIPNFVNSSNSLKKSKSEKVIETVIDELRKGENFLIYPAGKLKASNHEVIGGSSGVHRIIQEVPEANVVLIRTTGLWGSSFSKALTGKSPPMFETIWHGVKKCFKNFIFFTPRREVLIEILPAPADFPYKAPRLEFNRYLENWYDRPDGIKPTNEPFPGETLNFVSYSMWGDDFPVVKTRKNEGDNFEISQVPEDTKKEVIKKIAEMTKQSPESIELNMHLSSDLGLDSLDTAELSAFLQETYGIRGVPVNEFTTVSRVLGIASKQITFEDEAEPEIANLKKWNLPTSNELASIPEGETIPEVFLKTCEKRGNAAAMADARSGVITFNQAKLRVILLAEKIKNYPGKYVGILLPASTTAYLTVLACQLAGKVPVMINWTVGRRHLDTVVKLTDVNPILSSWAFLDRLENADLTGIEDRLVMLEDVARDLSLSDKIKAWIRSKKSTKSLLSLFNANSLSKKDPAVILFTSGTESLPKGVPLSHENILSNQRSALKNIEVRANDILFGVLPPFHSFGFTLTGLMPILGGIKVAFYPDPTNGPQLVKGIKKWNVTIMCGAPTFLKGMLKAAQDGELKSLRICASGAEKAPHDLAETISKKVGHNVLIEGYGITECSPVITMNILNKGTKGVGHALENVELLIVDMDKHEPVPAGTQGLILARGQNVFSGYLNKDVSSPFVTLNGKEWYLTGDLGHLDEENNLFISGRLKRFIKVGGEMISLAALEEGLLHLADKKGWSTIQDGPCLAVCAKELPGDKPKIVLFSRFAINIDVVNQSLREAGFSNLLRISDVKQVSSIPLMGTGKVNYRALESQI